jgi:hypothetical protein
MMRKRIYSNELLFKKELHKNTVQAKKRAGREIECRRQPEKDLHIVLSDDGPAE